MQERLNRLLGGPLDPLDGVAMRPPGRIGGAQQCFRPAAGPCLGKVAGERIKAFQAEIG